MEKGTAIISYISLASGIYLRTTEPPMEQLYFLWPQFGATILIIGFIAILIMD